MGRNLTNLPISASFQYLTQISGSELTDGLGADIDSLNISASYATSASHAIFADTAGFATDVNALYTASVSDATISFLKGGGGTFPITINNVANAVSASHAVNADNAVTAQTASFLPADTNLNINSITASNASFTSASIGYLQTITGSAKIIGDAFIILNNNTPTERYAGLVVQDSGSGSPLTTASLQFDGQTNDWFYEYSDDGGITVDHGVAMFGPEYSVKGVPTYNTANTLVKGDGGHHLLDSSISDDGTLVTINANVSASGYVSASSFIGDGSQLTNLPVSDPFPYTGSAIITGSLDVIGPLISGDGTNTVGTNGNEVAIGGNNNNVTGNRSAAIGGYTNSVTGVASVMLGGRANTLSGAWSAVIGGQGATASGYTSATIASETSTASNSYTFVAGAVSGLANQPYAVIVGGQNHRVTANSAGIFAGFDNDVSGIRSAAIGGTLANIDHARSVTLGGTSLATTKDDEVVVEHLTANGQVKGAINTLTDVAGTTALDCSVGNYFTLAMPAGGSTTLTPSNITAGQTINIKITQNATAATLAYAASIEFPGGTPFTISTGSGEVDVLTLVSFDGTTLQATGLANFS